jgi:tRNA-modifying protein YgfZ
MARISPLRKLHQQAEASLAVYGPPEADVQVVETFGELELEYAALRKACVLIDQPQRGIIEVTGADRLDFLNRMLTQELKGKNGLLPFQVRRSFWLNRKGRIDADLRVIELGDRTLLDVDTHAVERTITGLSNYVIAEDVQFRDLSPQVHRLALHGPTATALLREVSRFGTGTPLEDLTPGRAGIVVIGGEEGGGCEVIVDRDDSTGEVGLEMIVPVEAVVAVYQQFVEMGQEHNGGGGGNGGNGGGAESAARFRLRPAGWHAYNMARIEAGRPLYNIDFGPDSLPHETGVGAADKGGVLRDRVSFTKGCYLGQEIVARMEARGHPKQVLVAIRCEQQMMGAGGAGGEGTSGDIPVPRQPVTGSHVWPAAAPEGDPIGAVTSSTLSPMLGAAPICFAMVKYAHREPGTELLVAADGVRIKGKVQEQMAFWRRG